MKKTVSMILLFIMLSGLAVNASALITTIAPDTKLSYGSSSSFYITVSDQTVPFINGEGAGLLQFGVFHNLTHTPTRWVFYEEFEAKGLFGNGVYQVNYTADDFPYDDIQYVCIAYLWDDVYFADDVNPPTEQSIEIFSVGENVSSPLYLSLRNSDPWHLDFSGGVATLTDRGMTFQAYSLENIPIYYFVCNASVNDYGQPLGITLEKDMGILNAEFIPRETLSQNGTLWDIGQSIQNFTIPSEYFKIRRGYYVYVGVSKQHWENIGFTADSTFNGTAGQPFNFTMDSTNRGSQLWHGTDGDIDLYGFFLYFETFPRDGYLFPDDFLPSETPSNWFSVMARDWFDDIGLPWGYVLLGFFIPIFFVGLLYKFARQHNISVPSFIYSGLIVTGSIISFSIGIMELWMCAFISSVMVFVSAYTYKEEINTALQYTTGRGIGDRASIRVSEAGVTATRGVGRDIARPLSMRAGISRNEGVGRVVKDDFSVVYDNAKERELRQDLQRERESKGLGYPSASTSKVTIRALSDAEKDAFSPEKQKLTKTEINDLTALVKKVKADQNKKRRKK